MAESFVSPADGPHAYVQHVDDITVESKDHSAHANMTPAPEVVHTDNEIILDEKEITSQNLGYQLKRPAFSQPDFDEDYDRGQLPTKTTKEKFQSFKENCQCNLQCVGKSILSVFPFIGIMRKYNPRVDLINDMIAGLTVGIITIPQCLAYAMLTGLDPVYGLYLSLIPPFIYFFFGTSKHTSVGTFAVVSLMIGSTVDKGNCEELASTFGFGGRADSGNATSAPDEDAVMDCKVGIAMAVTLMGGLIQLLLGIFRMGFVTKYLSEPLTRGFTTGAAMHVFSSQIKDIFGISVPRYSGIFKLIYTYRDIFDALSTTNVSAVALSVMAMVVLWMTKEFLNPPVKKRIKAPIPIDLVVVIVATLVSYFGKFEEDYGMDVVGEIPMGIPPPKFPPVDRFGMVFGDAIALAVVAFAVSVSMAQLFANKHNYSVDANQELIAHGTCNSIGSCFNCYMMCVSLSRSLVQDNVGGRTQVATLFACSLILIVLYLIAPFFEPLPNCVLAAIIIVALKGMFLQFKDIPKLWRVSKTDLSVWLVIFVAVVLFDVTVGLVVGIGYGLLTIVGRTQSPYSTLLGQVPNTDMYTDIVRYSKAEEISGIVIYRFDGAIYYASREYFTNRLYKLAGCHPKQLKMQQLKTENKRNQAEKKHEKEIEKMEKQKDFTTDVGKTVDDFNAEEMFPMPQPIIHHVIIDCSTIGFLDTTGVTTLGEIVTDYNKVNVSVLLADCKGGVREMLENGGFHDRVNKNIMYPTVHDAVIYALEHHPDQQQKMMELTSDDYADSEEEDETIRMPIKTYVPDTDDHDDSLETNSIRRRKNGSVKSNEEEPSSHL